MYLSSVGSRGMEEDPRQLYSCVASSMGRRLISKASGTAFSFLPSLSQYNGFLLGPVFLFFLFFFNFCFLPSLVGQARTQDPELF